jgi:N-methylhydantoinase A
VRLAIDTGGTFTDLVVETETGDFRLYKTPTIATDPAGGVLEVLRLAAQDGQLELSEFLGNVDLFIHGTTRGLNAILTGEQARTAFVTTLGHRDILLFREGGRSEPFNNSRRYPAPYVPRRLTFEVRERIASDGRVLVQLDEASALSAIEGLAASGVEAVGVCFLWSIINASHELRFADLLDEHLPDITHTLSHALNPAVREYRRASAACIDASLKPVISRYVAELARRLGDAGFRGRILMATSGGGMMDVDDVIRAPIHSLRSGPAMAPVAGRHYAQSETSLENAIVADAGGTSYDVSLVRRGRLPWTREAWIGGEFTGHMTGFPSIDVKSIGAGGGSIAWVDAGRLLHVGPGSAGSQPGPACYGHGSDRPTVTDASLVLGYLDPANFLGGRISLDRKAAERALERHITESLGLDLASSASAVLEVMTEQMVQAIVEITIRQGVSPEDAVLVAGGGASGFNCVALARRLGCPVVLLPDVAPGLSAAGGLLSDLTSDTQITFPASTSEFDFEGVNGVLHELAERSSKFLRGSGKGALSSSVTFHAEARYPDQVWELDVPLRSSAFQSHDDVEALRHDFHAIHRETFAVADEASPVEVVTWGARAQCRLRPHIEPLAIPPPQEPALVGGRLAHFDGEFVECNVYNLMALEPEMVISGPAIIESSATTVVVPAAATIGRLRGGLLRISPWAREPLPMVG